MKVRVIKNTFTSPSPGHKRKWRSPKKDWYGWVVVDENIEPIMMPNCPFKTKKNAIKAIKNGRFESLGVTGITHKPIPSWHPDSAGYSDRNSEPW